MDKVPVFGTGDVGSIPTKGTIIHHNTKYKGNIEEI